MEAGRELDALIAEKVMGWSQKENYTDWFCEDQKTGWFLFSHDGIRGFHPSADIAAAWLVVEKLKDHDDGFIVLDYGGTIDKPWMCSWVSEIDDCQNSAMAETAPLAICLAALKASSIQA